jgi:preprotein translocase subunit SecY
MFPGLIFSWLASMFGAETGAIARFLRNMQDLFQPDHKFYWFSEFCLIVFFTYFYTAITMNPKEIADNLKKYGGFIPGIRAGRKTTEYIDRILNRITLAGGFALGLIAIVPQLMVSALGLRQMYFGGTSLLIVVGVALDTVRQMESHMVTRHYQGFMK